MKKNEPEVRLQPSLLEEAERVAKSEGVDLSQLVNVALAEKLSAIRTEDFFRERAKRGDIVRALEILSRVGGEPPRPDDML